MRQGGKMSPHKMSCCCRAISVHFLFTPFDSVLKLRVVLEHKTMTGFNCHRVITVFPDRH